MPGPTAEPTLEELTANLDRLNQSLMLTALARRLAERAIEAAVEARKSLDTDQCDDSNRRLGQSEAFTVAANLALAVAQEL
jgi:hypothetical protein